MKKRIVTSILSAVLTVSLAATAFADTNEEKLAATQSRLNDLVEERAEIEAEISEMNEDLVDLMLRIDETEQDIELTEDEIVETEKEIEVTKEDLKEERRLGGSDPGIGRRGLGPQQGGVRDADPEGGPGDVRELHRHRL